MLSIKREIRLQNLSVTPMNPVSNRLLTPKDVVGSVNSTERLSALDCPCCLETLVQPISYSCGHSVCADCLQEMAGDLCPMCRSNDPNVQIRNYTIEQVVQELYPDYYQEQSLERRQRAERRQLLSNWRVSPRHEALRRIISDTVSGSIVIGVADALLTIARRASDVMRPAPMEEECAFALAEWLDGAGESLALTRGSDIIYIYPGAHRLLTWLRKSCTQDKCVTFALIHLASTDVRRRDGALSLRHAADEIGWRTDGADCGRALLRKVQEDLRWIEQMRDWNLEDVTIESPDIILDEHSMVLSDDDATEEVEGLSTDSEEQLQSDDYFGPSTSNSQEESFSDYLTEDLPSFDFGLLEEL